MRKIILASLMLVFLMTPQSAQATMLNLTTSGSSGYLGEAFFQWTDFDRNATGTGTIQSFSQIQANGTQHGYNTTQNNTLNGGNSDQFNWQIPVSIVPVVTLSDTIAYREFLLDIAESRGQENEYLSLDDLQIFLTGQDNPNQAVETFDGNGVLELTNATMIYRMDNPGQSVDDYAMMNASLNPGNGKGDVLVYIPDYLFNTGLYGDHLYLYSRFGENASSDGSFEEWAVRTGDSSQKQVVPEPATMVLLASGLLGAFGIRRKI